MSIDLAKEYDKVNPDPTKESKFSKEVIEELTKKIEYEKGAIASIKDMLEDREKLNIPNDRKVQLFQNKLDAKERAVEKLEKMLK